MLFRAYIECGDLKNAGLIQDEMKKIDDEDILVNLCKIEWDIIKNEFDNALLQIQELRDKFEDSPKLISLAASVYMGKREFDKAEKHLNTVYRFYTENEERNNCQELSIILQNLIIVSTILSRFVMIYKKIGMKIHLRIL